MNLVKLRRLIREQIEASLNGSEPAVVETPPQTFSEFRVWFGGRLEAAGAPADLVEVVTDLDRDDNILVTRMMNAWLDLSEEVAGVPDAEQVSELFAHYAMEISEDMNLKESVAGKLQNLLND